MNLEIKLWDEPVGVLSLIQNRVYFEYEPKFLKKNWDISPLLMPVENANGKVFNFSVGQYSKQTFKELPPVFADSLPDKFGSQVFNLWLQKSGKTMDDLNPLEKLSYIGKRGMGALEYFPDIKINPENSININDIVKIAENILNDKYHQVTDLNSIQNIIHIGTSAGGARAKAIIAINPNNDVLPGDILYSDPMIKYYILKIDGLNDKSLGQTQNNGKIEYAYYQMAKDSQINMMNSSLLSENGRHHFLTERFDRINGKKLHTQTLCSLANMDYNLPDMHSYEQAFGVLEKLNLPFENYEQLYKVMVFNAIGHNNDDHTKNISFIMDKTGKWSLAPAYDMCYSFNSKGLWTNKHQMSINGKRENFTLPDLLAVGRKFNIRNRKKIIKNIANVISNWKIYANKLDIPQSKIQFIDEKLNYKIFQHNSLKL